MYSSEYWYLAENYAPDWDRRSELAAKLLTNIDQFNLFELGSGPRFPLKVALADSIAISSYLACDLVQWDSRVMILDLNNSDDLNFLGVEARKISCGATVFSLLGVLEYLEDVRGTLQRLKPYCDFLLVSYCCRKNKKNHNSNWQNSYSEKEFLDILDKLNFRVERYQDFEDFKDFSQKIFLVKTLR